MSTRLAKGGRLIDRTAARRILLQRQAPEGLSRATALPPPFWPMTRCWSAAASSTTARAASSPRGPKSRTRWSTSGQGARLEPNQRTTTTELFDGLEATSQNHWPSLEFDVGVLNNYAARFLPAGFYYKTFIHPRPFWKHVFEPIIRRAAGLGKAPTTGDADRYEQAYAFCDVLVVGAGVAGLLAAKAAAGCRATRDPAGADPRTSAAALRWTRPKCRANRSRPGFPPSKPTSCARDNVTIRTRTCGFGVYDHGYVLADERVADHTPGDGRPKHRLWRIRTGKIVTATGAIERPLSFRRQRHPRRDAGRGRPRLCGELRRLAR